MAVYEITAPDGSSWEVTAPDSATEADVLAYAKKQWQEQGLATAEGPKALSDQQKDRAGLSQRADSIRGLIQQLEEQGQEEDVIAPMRKELAALQKQIAKTGVGSIGNTIGSTVGGVGGAIVGGVLGAPLGPGGMIAGGVAGGAAGSALGAGLGTKYDLSQAESVSEEDAWKLVKDNAVEAAAWDAGLTLLTLGTGKVLKVTGASEALKKALQEAGANTNAKRMAKAMAEQRVAGESTDALKEGLIGQELKDRYLQAQGAREVGRNAKPNVFADNAQRVLMKNRGLVDVLGQQQATASGIQDAARKLVTEEGRIPTKGQITGDPGLYERMLRLVGERQYNVYSKELGTIAETIRQKTLNEIDDDFIGRTSLGESLGTVQKKAKAALDTATKPVWEAARQANAAVDMEDVRLLIKKTLERDAASGNAILLPNERAYFERVLDTMASNPSWTAEAAQDFLSGAKARIRDLTQEGAPSKHMKATLIEVTEAADKKYLEAIGTVKDGALKKILLDTRKKYGEFMQDVYSDTMQKIVSKNPERAGAEIFGGGHVTEVKEVRAALNKALETKGITQEEYDKLWSHVQRGYLERLAPNVESLATLQKRLTENPDLRRTFVEMTHADPKFLSRIQTLTSMAKVVERIPTESGFVQLLPAIGGAVVGHMSAGPAGAAAVGGGSALLKKALIRMSTSPRYADVVPAMRVLLAQAAGSKATISLTANRLAELRKAAEQVERWWRAETGDSFFTPANAAPQQEQ